MTNDVSIRALPFGEYRVLTRPYLRPLLACAALAAALALAGCTGDGLSPSGRAQAPLSDKIVAEIAAKNMDKNSPILTRIFKEEAEMEVWKQTRDGEYALLKTYPICRWSGDLGPKKKEGDRQAPEGFYTITPGQMNPNSSFYLAFNTGFPNAYDRAFGYTGSDLMVHGDCSSRGCYAMTDEQMAEIYALARESFFGGQRSFQLQAFPFRMTALNMARHRNSPHFAFWKMIKEGYDHFEATKQEPKVAVCERRYVFNPAQPENASRPLAFNPTAQCPAYELDKAVADAVLEHRRNEQTKMAEYIASGVSPARPRHGIDGGMNPVFAEKITTQEGYDSRGRLVRVATAPGALPREPGSRAVNALVTVPDSVPSAEPVAVANVPMPATAPQAKQGAAPAEKTIAGLIGNVFSSPAPAPPAATAAAPELRGSSSDTAAARRATPAARTASTPPPKPKFDVATKQPGATQPAARQAAAEPQREPELRTAFSTTPAPASASVLSGAQPVVPTGSFDSRWSGFR